MTSAQFELAVERYIDAPPETVFKVWTERLEEWWAPKPWTTKIIENDLETEPIFSLLEQKYNTPLVEAEYCLEAISADMTVARALGLGAGSPIFLIERTSYTTAHQPIDYEKLYYRGDLIKFVTRLSRRPRART